MIKKIIVEVPVSWFDNPLDGAKNKRFFFNFLSVLANRNEPIYLRKVPFGADVAPRLPGKGELVFSYHTRGAGKNVFSVKEAPISPLIAIDRSGYSGWADIALSDRYDRKIESISIESADSIIEKYRKSFVETGVSKYPQKEQAIEVLPDRYVFFPLQVQNDPVSELSQLSAMEILARAAEVAEENKIHLLLKRHPFCQSLAIEEMIGSLCRANSYVKLVEGNVHQIIPRAHSIITVNSGVGLEALIHGASVYSTGTSEWYRSTHRIDDIDGIKHAFLANQTGMEPFQRKLVAYLLSEYWVDSENPVSVDEKINECFAEFDHEYGIDGEKIDSSEVLVPIILDIQGKLDYEMRRAKLLSMDIDALQRDRADRISMERGRIREHEALLEENRKLLEENIDYREANQRYADENQKCASENQRLVAVGETLQQKMIELDRSKEDELRRLSREIDHLKREVSEMGRRVRDWPKIAKNIVKTLIGR